MMGHAFHGEKKPVGCFAKGVIGTVIGLVAMALLYPMITPARIGHGPPQCISKLRQLAFAQLIYAQDNDDGLPPDYSFEGPGARVAFVAATLPYSKDGRMYVCPFSPEAKMQSQVAKPALGYQHFPLILKLQSGKGFIRLADVKEPAKAVWMHDAIVKLEVKDDGEHVETPHGPGNSGFFLSFFDGHARWTPTTSGQSTEWINTLGVWQE